MCCDKRDMINDDEDDDGVYDGASGLKIFYFLFEVIVTYFIFFSKQQFIYYLVLIKYSCLLVIIAIGLYHYRIMT